MNPDPLDTVAHASTRAPRVTVEQIKRVVCEEYNLPAFAMTNLQKDAHVTRPRMMAMALCREYTSLSFQQIGLKFGGRDHSTVSNALTSIERLCASDERFAGARKRLRQLLDTHRFMEGWVRGVGKPHPRRSFMVAWTRGMRGRAV